MIIKLKIHSVVDVITNSSTVIYTYQNSTSQAKELVEEMLKLTGETDKTADDIFYYGVFCDDDKYLESDAISEQEGYPEYPADAKYDSPERKAWNEASNKWLSDLQASIMKGDIDQPQWMTDAEGCDDYDYWSPSSYLCLVPKEEKYKEFGHAIQRLLGSVDADGGRDG